MQNQDDLSVFDTDDQALSPLDELAAIDDSSAADSPDPELMLSLLHHEEPGQRMIAARAFCDLQDDRAIPRLIELLHDTCPLVRVSVAYALGRNPSPEAIAPLMQVLAEDWNGYVRKGVVWALGNCGDRRAVPSLLHALRFDISAVRLWAASSIAQVAKLDYGDTIATMPILIECLRRDAIAAVRSNCAWSIGTLCKELPSNVVYATAVDALIEALVEDEDYGVKEDAKAALLKVGDPRGMEMIEDLEFEGLI